MYKNTTFLQIQLQVSIVSFICNLPVNKTKNQNFLLNITITVLWTLNYYFCANSCPAFYASLY